MLIFPLLIICLFCSYVEILHLVCPIIRVQNPYVCLFKSSIAFHIAKRETEIHLLDNSAAFSVVRRRYARVCKTGPNEVVCTLSSVLKVPASIPDPDGRIRQYVSLYLSDCPGNAAILPWDGPSSLAFNLVLNSSLPFILSYRPACRRSGERGC